MSHFPISAVYIFDRVIQHILCTVQTETFIPQSASAVYIFDRVIQHINCVLCKQKRFSLNQQKALENLFSYLIAVMFGIVNKTNITFLIFPVMEGVTTNWYIPLLGFCDCLFKFKFFPVLFGVVYK